MRLLRVSMLALLCLLPNITTAQEPLEDDLPIRSIDATNISLEQNRDSEACKRLSSIAKLSEELKPKEDEGTSRDIFKCFSPPAEKLKRNTLYLFHFVRWEDSISNNGPKLTRSEWFAYRYDRKDEGKLIISVLGKDRQQKDLYDFTDFYIYSISQIRTTESRNNPAPRLMDTVEVVKQKAANIEALRALIVALTGASLPSRTGQGLISAITPIFKYNYSVTVATGTNESKSPPFDWKFTARARGTATAALDDKDNTCFNLTLKSDCTLTRTFSVLDREYWSLGIDIIPRPPLENTYGQTSAGVITRSQPRHSAFYVTADINPFAHLWPMSRGPYFQFGLPVTGAALHAPYTGIAQPLGRLKILPIPLSVFGGVIYMKQTFPRTLAVGGTATTDAFAADLRTDRAIKPVFGVEVPLAALIGKVKSGFFK